MTAVSATASWRSPSLLVVPPLIYLALCFFAPILILGVDSVALPTGWSVDAYRRFFGEPFRRALLWNSLEYAAIVTAICLALGYPFAYAMARVRPVIQAIFLLAVFLPLTASVIVKAFGWTILLRANGVVNGLLLALGVIDEPLRIVFTFTGLIIGTVNILLPFMVLPIYAVLKTVDLRLEDAAAVLGASPLSAFRRVILPLSLPGVIAGVALVFTQAVAAYAIPTLLAGDRIRLMSRQAANHFLVLRDDVMGAAISMILLATALTAVFLATLALGRRGTRSVAA